MLTNYFLGNWTDVLIIVILFLLAIVPIFPCTWGGANKTYFDINKKEDVIQRNFNFIELTVRLFSSVVLLGPALSMGFRGTVTMLLFVVLIADLILNKTITNNAITISIVGIVALYLENILDKAEEISISKIFYWKAKQFPPGLEHANLPKKINK